MGQQEVMNFGRFYASLHKLPYRGDLEELKRNLVTQYTWGRTDSLREVTLQEYDGMCAALEKMVCDEERSEWLETRRRRRSACLKLMQQLGVDTGDWARVNDFCRNPRIAGKDFARISVEELGALAVKLRAIERKGGLRQWKEAGSVMLVVGRGGEA